ncbi:MAG: glycoside hydrolase family 2 TIM barrel-domain containing protein [bacterium]
MKRIDFNHDWICKCLTRPEAPVHVTLPHDAMLSEPRTEDSVAEGNIGWYIGGDYEYVKRFDAPEDWRGKVILIEFESVSRDAEVWVNGNKVASRPYGYTNFYVDLAPYLNYGEENELRVIAHNSEHPNSRWYSGTGIYRPVWLHIAEPAFIPVNGLKIRTVSIAPAVVEISVKTSQKGAVTVEIVREGRTVVRARASSRRVGAYVRVPATFGQSAQTLSPAQQCVYEAIFRVGVPNAALWDCDHPNLYTCRATIEGDEATENFGIRELKWNPTEGMTINGERVILRGACIHHDNGLLGACTYPEAEARRVRLLKENGYNALRSAHNPCSKALLDACDRLGMLMMDEFADVWYIHKTRYDYALHLKDWWQDDLREMVEKDYNHPCVIMYSTGNEVAETSERKGIAFTGEMTRYLHGLDPTRPVSCGINIFFNFLYSIGFGVYSDDKAAKQQQAAAKPAKQKKKHVGSDFYNTVAALLGTGFMKFGASLYFCDLKTRDAYANMDIAGYNYGILRYKHDMKKYPARLILGSETFCKDAYSFWEIAKKNPRIVGDFVWSGMDYIGETGDGAAEYADYKGGPATRMTGGNGRIDLCGKPKAEAAYTRVALEREMGPFIAVEPVYEEESPRFTGWQLTKAIESWSWDGCDGKQAKVEVYARAARAEVLVNGQSMGRARLKNGRAKFIIPYASGKIEVVTCDAHGRRIGHNCLVSAGEETMLRVTPESESVGANGLVYIPIQYTDDNGVWKPMEKHLLKVSVENGKLLGLGNGCPYFKGNYTQSETQTYFGEALAIVQADGTGDLKVTVSDGERTEVARVLCLT